MSSISYSQKFADEVLTNPDVVMRSVKERIIKADCSLLLSEAKTHPSQSIVAEVAMKRTHPNEYFISWKFCSTLCTLI